MLKYYKPSRIAAIFVIMGVLVAIYMTSLYKLQIFDKTADANAWLARNTTKQAIALTADRGDILDRNGTVLVSTRAAYNVTLSREVLLGKENMNDIILALVHYAVDVGVNYTDTFPITAGAPFSYLYDMTTSQKARLKAYLAFFELPEDITASELIIWMKEHYELDYTTNISDARLIIGVRYELEMRAVMSLDTYVFAEDVDTDFISLLKEQQQQFPGVIITTSAERVYHTKYAAHLLGYIGKMNSTEFEDKYSALGYSYSSMVGKDGAEKAFEEYLHGSDGAQMITTQANGTVVDENTTKEPVPGENVFLSIDIGLQAVCEDSLAAKIDVINADPEREDVDRVTGGAVVVTDVNTGEVLACCSYPTYDLSNFLENYTDLSNNTSKPLYNRATQGSYEPGSTFKMVTALAGLKTGKITPATTVNDTGVYMAYADSNYTPVCWIYSQTGVGHGIETVVTALRDSCNTFFYWLGDALGADAITDTAADFGLGSKTGIEVPESAGILGTAAWKEETLKEDWWAGDTLQTAIGQGFNKFTPVQLASYVATIANGGTKYPLTMLSYIRSADFSSVVYTPDHTALGMVSGSEYISYLQQGMTLVASDGTASKVFGNYPVKVAAKTGTVQTGGDAKLNNGLFVCYAPADNPEIAIALVVEKGTSGSTIMEIAKDVMDYYFRTKAANTVAVDNTILP